MSPANVMKIKEGFWSHDPMLWSPLATPTPSHVES